ncbi:MAG: hypothetical protein U9N33_10535 [Campylobacterota bacterium]|nr:hypothetical protein [Campylobacterota bacterium]
MTMSMNLHPQYITNDNGEKMSVVLSMQEFENILEDFEDLSIVAQRKDEKSIMKTLHIKPKHINLFDLLLSPFLLVMRFILSLSLGMHSQLQARNEGKIRYNLIYKIFGATSWVH